MTTATKLTLVRIVLIPVFLLVLYLGFPGANRAALGIFIMCTSVFEHMSMGHWMIMSASGRIALYQLLVGVCYACAFPIGWVAIGRCGVMGVGWTLAITLFAAIAVRLAMVRRNFGIGPGHWIFRICLPTVAVSVVAYAAARIPAQFFAPSLARVAASTLCAEAVFVPLVWHFVLDASERDYVLGCLRQFLSRFRK